MADSLRKRVSSAFQRSNQMSQDSSQQTSTELDTRTLETGANSDIPPTVKSEI